MKNFILIVIVSLIMTMTYSSCKKDDSCSFNKSSIQNKTYKSTFYVDSNGIDVTKRLSTFFPCYNSLYTTYKPDGTYTTDTRGCISDVKLDSGTWSTLSENNKNYLVFNDEGARQEVFEFNCNSFKTKVLYGPIANSIITITFTSVK